MRKRLHFRNAVYHITTNTQNKFPYFEEEIFCNIFLDNLAYHQKGKSFELIAIKINPDHSHIILQPTGEYNISQIIQSVKRSTSDQINQIIYNLRNQEENPLRD